MGRWSCSKLLLFKKIRSEAKNPHRIVSIPPTSGDDSSEAMDTTKPAPIARVSCVDTFICQHIGRRWRKLMLIQKEQVVAGRALHELYEGCERWPELWFPPDQTVVVLAFKHVVECVKMGVRRLA